MNNITEDYIRHVKESRTLSYYVHNFVTLLISLLLSLWFALFEWFEYIYYKIYLLFDECFFLIMSTQAYVYFFLINFKLAAEATEL